MTLDSSIDQTLGRGLAVTAGLAAVITWGLTPAATRYLVLRFDPLTVVSLRFAVTLAIITPFVIFARPWRDCRNSLTGALLGVLGFLGYNLPNHLGAGAIPSAYASLIIAIEPPLIAFIAAALGATLTRKLWLGIVLSLFGALLPASAELSIDRQGFTKGYVFVAVGALCWSLFSVLAKPVVARMGAIRFALVSTFGGACACSLLAPHAAWIAVADLNASDWTIIGFAAVMSTVAAAIGWSVAIGILGPGVAGPLLSLIPVIGLTFGVGILREQFSSWAIAGATLTTLGVIVSMYPRRKFAN